MIKLYGSPRSSAGRCYWCLHELGIPFESAPVNMKEKEHKSEEFLSLNPNGKVPVLVDGDFVIWESMAINTYLAEKYKPELLGQDPESRGLVQQWSYWSILELQPPIIEIFIQKFFVPEEHRSQEIIDKALEKIPERLNILEQALKGKANLVGDHFTLADLHAASVASLAFHLKMDMSSYPEISRWLGAISQRPANQEYQKLMAE